MLAIRMQRTGRSGHTQFRVIVQDTRFSPKSGRVTAYVGSYDPHSKVATLDKDKVAGYLSNGAQPSDRVAKLLKKEGVKLPDWVKLDGEKQRNIRNPEKLRRNRPPEAEAPAEETPSAEASADEVPAAETETKEAPAEEKTEVAAAETEAPVESEQSPAEETPVEESTPTDAEKPETNA